MKKDRHEIEDKVKQHEEILAELIHLNESSEKRLRTMETLSAVTIPVLVISFFSGIYALLVVFGIF